MEEKPKEILEESWNSFSESRAEAYLKTFGHPSKSSRELLIDILRKDTNGKKFSVLDIGCGNAQLYEYMKSSGLNVEYTGVDFSEKLLEAAKKNNPEATFIHDDVQTLDKINGQYDYVIYSHVIEMLASPEHSLMQASKLSKTILVRFFEPPVFEYDTVDLKMMETAENLKVPYLRRKMSHDYYDMILKKIGCQKLYIRKDNNSKDQIHIIHLSLDKQTGKQSLFSKIFSTWLA